MKIKISAFAVLMGLSLVMSCGSDDDGGDPPNSGDFNYEGTEYEFTTGYSVDGVEPSFGYYYTDFALGTSAFTLDESALPTVAISDFQMTRAILYVNLLNEGDTFETGTYVFSNTEMPKYFEFGYIRVPGADGEFNLDDAYLSITGGSITVSGAPLNYSLTFNMTVGDGQNVNFTYDHNLMYLDAF